LPAAAAVAAVAAAAANVIANRKWTVQERAQEINESTCMNKVIYLSK